jgi:hypothetical protein
VPWSSKRSRNASWVRAQGVLVCQVKWVAARRGRSGRVDMVLCYSYVGRTCGDTGSRVESSNVSGMGERQQNTTGCFCAL